MKFFWFCLTLLTLSTWQLPAWAGQLIFWEFDEQRRELEFRTNARVQPQAQLIANPSRLVIDLPGTTLDRPLLNRSYSGNIRAIRLGQFTPDTARLVVELAPGYTLDPNQIKFEGRSPRDWAVILPEPERISFITPTPSTTSQQPTPPDIDTSFPPTFRNAQTDDAPADRLKVTQSGFLLDLDQASDGEIETEQDGDRFTFTFEDLTLPSDLVDQTITVDRYKVERISFEQPERDEVQITLDLEEDSPQWRAIYSSSGDLVLLPSGGTAALESRESRPVEAPERIIQTTTEKTTVESVDLANNDRQLILRGSDRLDGVGAWNRSEGLYQIRINNAQLAQPVRGPVLTSRSPVSKISMRQETENTVLIQIEPALGVQIGKLSQPSDDLIALDLNRLRNIETPNANNSGTNNTTNNGTSSIFVPPPDNEIFPINTNVPLRDVLVMIDPGHGGKDPGAVGIGGLQEKQVILPISQEVARILRQNNVNVQMTRDTDYFVSLQGRTQLANRAGADLFVSIHANAISLSRPDVNGLEVFYFQSAKSRSLSQTIHRSILSQIRMRDRGVKTARFYVLRNTAMPSALVEVGFVTGREDAPNLSSPDFRDRMAQAIADGILEYIQTNNL